MKILLINPPPYNNDIYNPKAFSMPLGLGYIASVLEKAGYRASIIDAYAKNLSFEEMKEIVRQSGADIIGIQCLSNQRASWYRLIKIIRAVDDSIKIVLGGAHPTLMPEQVLTNFRPDVIVIGEGEETMLELVKTWEDKGDLSIVKGIAYLKNGDVVITPPRERIKDLDSLPFPAHHLVDLNDYIGWDLIDTISRILGMETPPKYAAISTSRGCIGDCGYCSAPLIWKRRWTQRSAINVVDEMEMLNRRYSAGFIIVTDDMFTVSQKRVIAISEEILKRNLKLLWGFETAVNLVSPGLLRIAKEAGCCCILYGVESGSQTVLSNVSKKISGEEVVNAFKVTKETGIVAGAFLMVGNPGESEKSINDTIQLLRKIEPDIVIPQITMITPGTKIFSIAKEKGFIDEDYWLTDLPFPHYIAERRMKTLLRWYRKLFYYKRSNFGILLRTIRDYIELYTGIRASKRGLSRVKTPMINV